MTPIEARVDELLSRLGAQETELNRVSGRMESEMAAIRAAYTLPMAKAQQAVSGLTEELESLVKTYRAAILSGRDRADLPNGSVMLKIEIRVKRIRDMLDRLEVARRTELIKIAKSVDWDSVEKLTDAELAVLGTKRQKKELFSYEIKG